MYSFIDRYKIEYYSAMKKEGNPATCGNMEGL